MKAIASPSFTFKQLACTCWQNKVGKSRAAIVNAVRVERENLFFHSLCGLVVLLVI